MRTNTISYDKQNILKAIFAVHINEHLLGIHLLCRKFTAILPANLSEQRILPIDSLAALLTVHRFRSRLVQRRQLSLLPDVVQQLHGRLGRQTLLEMKNHRHRYKVIIVDLDHRSVGTRSQALHLQQSEQTILCRLPILDPELLLQRLENLLRSAQHARRGAACLDEELSHLLATSERDGEQIRSVHRVEGHHLVHLHRRHLENLCYFVHRSERDVISALPVTEIILNYLSLSKIEQRHNSRLLIVLRISFHDLVHSPVIICREIERGIDIVIGRVIVLDKSEIETKS